jgi:hypothetical protein
VNPGEWIGLSAVIVTAIGLLVHLATSKRSEDTAERRWKAENEPDIIVDYELIAKFSKGEIMRDEITYSHGLPEAYDPPWPVVVVTIRNRGKVTITVKQLVLRLARDNRTVPFQGADLSPVVRFPVLPAEVPPGRLQEANIDPREVKRMLRLVNATPADYFTIDAIDVLDDSYSTCSIPAGAHLGEIPVFRRTLTVSTHGISVGPLTHHGPVTAEQLAEYRRKNTRSRPD